MPPASRAEVERRSRASVGSTFVQLRIEIELLKRRLAIVEGDTGGGGPGPSPGGSYRHVQAVAASTWVVDHDLGFYPNVVVEDSGGSTVEGEIVFDTVNRITLTFSAAFSGTAYLS